jgi:phage/plasmid-associated DNA primase
MAIVDEYIKNSGIIISDFIKERCLVDSKQTCAPSDLYKAYRDYCEENGEIPFSRHNFMAYMLKNLINVSVTRDTFEPGEFSTVILKGIAVVKG